MQRKRLPGTAPAAVAGEGADTAAEVSKVGVKRCFGQKSGDFGHNSGDFGHNSDGFGHNSGGFGKYSKTVIIEP